MSKQNEKNEKMKKEDCIIMQTGVRGASGYEMTQS
jgi:hypothetical protein